MNYMKKVLILSVISLVASVNFVLPITGAQAAGNHTPVWSETGSRTIYAGQVLNLMVYATDADHDFLYYDVLNLPAGAYFEPTSHTLYWKPSQNQLGSHSIQFSVTDNGPAVYQTVNINVLSNGTNSNTTPTPMPSPTPSPTSQYNNPPQFFGFNPGTTAVVNQLYTYDANATDPDGNALTYSLISAPSGMAINTASGFIAWVPVSSQVGSNSVRVAVSDGRAQTTADFNITAITGGSPTPVSAPTPVPPPNPTPAPTEAKIIISDIKIENVDGEIAVSWETNIPSDSRVIYGTASQADRTRNFSYANATPNNRELVTDHKTNLGKLEINIVYYLRVVSKTDLQTVVSQEIGFIQLASGEVRGLFGASLLDIFGSLFHNDAFLWILILALGIVSFSFYRKQKKDNTVI